MISERYDLRLLWITQYRGLNFLLMELVPPGSRAGERQATVAFAEDSGDITFAFAGDAMPTRRVSVHAEPEFLAVAGLLRGADVAIANSETLYHQFEGYPVADAGPYGTYVATDPAVIDDLRWLGLDMVATANNHCVDYGEAGLLANLANLEDRGLPCAGTGRSLTEAARPRYLATARGTVALVAVTLTMPPGGHRAGEARGAVKARPGANVLRHAVTHELPPDAFQALLDLGAGLGAGLGRHFRRDGDLVTLDGRAFTRGSEYRTTTVIDPFDLELNLRWIAEARQLADWVVVSAHCHESGATREQPPGFAVEFAHRAVDAGADVVFGHGPHADRGIELYQGKPILYALGNFILQNETIPQQPWDFTQRLGLPPTATTGDAYRARAARSRGGLAHDPASLRSAVAEVAFRGGRLEEIRLHPLDLGAGTPQRRRAGRPLRAGGEVAAAVIERFTRLSAAFGTTVNERGQITCD
jgi:poly-gamma-glutamate capsule biosynthesis protein CapA/YwtB (metallophosphatase superfamily)